LSHFQLEKPFDFVDLCRVQIPLGTPHLFRCLAGLEQRVTNSSLVLMGL